MAGYKYAFKDYDMEKMARCAILSASVSTKHCIEICNRIRGRKTEAAKKILTEAIEFKKPIPFRRFNHNMGHKRATGPGRYPVKACTEILKAIESCEANAQAKGFSSSDLVITHICSNMASRPWHYGRARRRKSKRTHIEIVLKESGSDEKSRNKKGKDADINKEDKKADETKEKPMKAEKKTEERKAAEQKPAETPAKTIKPVEKKEEKAETPAKKPQEKPAVTKGKQVEPRPKESKQIKKEDKSPGKSQEKKSDITKDGDKPKDKGAMKDGPKKDTVKED